MKDIRQFISEKQDWWTGKDAQLINKNDLIKFAKEALKQTKLDEALENERLDYCKFEDALANLLANDDKYGGKEGDICDHLWVHVWDLLDELQ